MENQDMLPHAHPCDENQCEPTKIRRISAFGALFLLVLSQCLYFTFPIPFLTTEIVKGRDQNVVIGGVLAGTYALTLAASALFSSFITSSFKRAICLAGLVCFLSSIVFVIPMHNNVLFVAMVFLTRVIQGIAVGLTVPKMVAEMGALYKDSLGMVTAAYELAFSAALAVGPLMGGFLYDVGGFYLPFTVTGSLLLLISGMTALILPNKHPERPEHPEEPPADIDITPPSFSTRFLTPSILLLGILIMSTVAADESFLANFLGVYLKDKYQKDVEVTGTILMACGVVYSSATLIFGFLTDRMLSRAISVLVGFVVLILGTAFVDVSMFGQTWSSYLYPGCMFALVEVGSAMIQISVLPLLVFHDPEPDQDISTEKMAGIYNFGFMVGAFFGPLIGSSILHFLSFYETFTIFAALMFFVLLIIGGANIKIKNLLTIKKKFNYALLHDVNDTLVQPQ